MSRRKKTKDDLIQEIQQLQKRVAEMEETEKRFCLFSETTFEGIVLSKDSIFVDFSDQFLT